MNCTCDSPLQGDATCGVCRKLFRTEANREQKILGCFVHGPSAVFFCGISGYTCGECRSKGLTYISGHGGSPYVHDANLDDQIMQ